MDSTSLFIEGTKIYAYISMAIFFGIAVLVYFATRWDERGSKVCNSKVNGSKSSSSKSVPEVGDKEPEDSLVLFSVGKLKAGDKLMVIRGKTMSNNERMIAAAILEQAISDLSEGSTKDLGSLMQEILPTKVQPYQTASVYVLSKNLRQFLTEWYEWATTEPVEDKFPHLREAGLCSGLWRWCGKNGMGNQSYRVLFREMQALFGKDNLEGLYPFGENNFNCCMYARSQHKDPNRLAWVKGILNQGTDQLEKDKPAPDLLEYCQECSEVVAKWPDWKRRGADVTL